MEFCIEKSWVHAIQRSVNKHVMNFDGEGIAVFIFGSRCSGANNQDSDLDILVKNGFFQIPIFTLDKINKDLFEIPVEKDIWCYHSINPCILERIKNYMEKIW